MHSRAISNRGAGGVVIATASRPSMLRINSRQSVKVRRNALPRTAGGRDQLEAPVSGNRWHMLVGGDLAKADDRDRDRLHAPSAAT